MPLETLFSVAGALAMLGWLLLMILPKWYLGTRLLVPVVIPLVLAVGYAVLLIPNITGADGGFGTLAEVGALFQVPELLLAGWVHYLAFDLFIGAWEVRDAQRAGLHHLLVVPCLLATLLAGPLGLALYLVVRATKGKALLDE